MTKSKVQPPNQRNKQPRREHKKVFRGDRLRILRDETETMTQEDLAKALKVGVTTIHRWETGEQDPAIDKVLQLAKLFNVHSPYLTGESDARRLSGVQLDEFELAFVEALRRRDYTTALTMLVDRMKNSLGARADVQAIIAKDTK